LGVLGFELRASHLLHTGIYTAWTTTSSPSFLFYLFFVVLGLELRTFTFSPSTNPTFCDMVFWDRVSQTVCLDWLWTVILLISASWVGRITGMSHWCPARFYFWDRVLLSSPHWLPTSASQVLVLQMCTTMTGFNLFFFFFLKLSILCKEELWTKELNIHCTDTQMEGEYLIKRESVFYFIVEMDFFFLSNIQI
jgi:hypothetical protein